MFTNYYYETNNSVSIKGKIRPLYPILRLTFLCLLVLLACMYMYVYVRPRMTSQKQPNIIFMLVDDLGYNDLGYVRDGDFKEIRTPFIDRLAKDSLQLDHSYVQPICSASRAALLTGRYPFRYGFQRTALMNDEMSGLHDQLFPERLQELGYQTHLIGKWHLGHCKKEYTPLHKGFHTFRGYLNGNEGYYTHKTEKLYYDYYLDDQIIRNHKYSTYDYAMYTEDLIMNNTDSRPMFMYIAAQAPHMPYDPPPGVPGLDKDSDPDLRYRKIVETLDVYVERLYRALSDRGMLDNTVFIFSSDNGASSHGGSNFPLRGLKQDLFDGATRVRSFISGPGFSIGRYLGLFHITDWFPTLLRLAGDTKPHNPNLDGVDQLQALTENILDYDLQPRKSFIYDINEKELKNGTIHSAAVRLRTRNDKGYMKDYKLIYGLPGPSEPALNSRDGLLFDMEMDEGERKNLKGLNHIRDMMKYMAQEEKEREYQKRDPVFNGDAYTMTDEKGQPIIAPGWC